VIWDVEVSFSIFKRMAQFVIPLGLIHNRSGFIFGYHVLAKIKSIYLYFTLFIKTNVQWSFPVKS
jgi:hypothetical protein